MQTHFSAHTLAEIFRDIYLSERDGELLLTQGKTEKRIRFRRGLICEADSNLPEDDLGERLVRERTISPGALEEARSNAGENGSLARVLVDRDLVPRAAMEDALRRQIDQIVGSVFRWEGGQARFGELAVDDVPIDGDVLSTCQAILNGVFLLPDFDPIHEAMIELDRTLVLRRPSPVPVERLRLSPAHGFVLSRLDGSTTLREIATILPPDEEQGASRLIFGLLVMGVVDFDPPLSEGPFRVTSILRDHADRTALERMQARTIEHAYASTGGQDAWTVLGIKPSDNAQVIERAYEQAKALFSRERLLPRVREQFRTELAVIESRLIEAYLKLSHPEREETSSAPAEESRTDAREDVEVDDLLMRVELDKTESKRAHEKATQTAEGYFSKARKSQREGDFHNAIQFAKLAVSYNDRDARFYFLMAECQMRNPGPRWQHLAEQNFTKAIELDPWNPDYVIALGRFYKARGLSLRAKKQFEEALRLSPAHATATEELAALSHS